MARHRRIKPDLDERFSLDGIEFEEAVHRLIDTPPDALDEDEIAEDEDF